MIWLRTFFFRLTFDMFKYVWYKHSHVYLLLLSVTNMIIIVINITIIINDNYYLETCFDILTFYYNYEIEYDIGVGDRSLNRLSRRPWSFKQWTQRRCTYIYGQFDSIAYLFQDCSKICCLCFLCLVSVTIKKFLSK